MKFLWQIMYSIEDTGLRGGPIFEDYELAKNRLDFMNGPERESARARLGIKEASLASVRVYTKEDYQ